MVITQIPPIWTDRDTCFRCRTSFSAFTRKHHCRACGETFCSTCSSKQSSLLEYGIEDEVRVCESCYDRLLTTGSVRSTSATPAATSAVAAAAVPKFNERSQAELEDEHALQLAISLSQREAEERERQKKLLTQQYATSTLPYLPTPLGSAPVADQDDGEQKAVVGGGGGGELAKYLDRNYWEAQAATDREPVTLLPRAPSDQYVRDEDIDRFTASVHEHINNIKFRMLSNQQRGRNIGNDTAVQSVFVILQHMYPESHRFIKSLDDKQAYYESLQDKLGQLKDAREALNALRDEHMENKKRQAMERERQRQIQLAVKLDDMRQKKQAYLEYQRHVHLQRLGEQEAEMQARLDQQRRYAQQREQQNQMSFAQASLPLGYYHAQQPMPSTQFVSHPISMRQLSDALPLPPTMAPPMSQGPSPYSLQPSMPANEQTLISFD